VAALNQRMRMLFKFELHKFELEFLIFFIGVSDIRAKIGVASIEEDEKKPLKMV